MIWDDTRVNTVTMQANKWKPSEKGKSTRQRFYLRVTQLEKQ